jgi:hypothetical protein
MAQHLICNQGVTGSNPAIDMNKINDLGDSKLMLGINFPCRVPCSPLFHVAKHKLLEGVRR